MTGAEVYKQKFDCTRVDLPLSLNQIATVQWNKVVKWPGPESVGDEGRGELPKGIHIGRRGTLFPSMPLPQILSE